MNRLFGKVSDWSTGNLNELLLNSCRPSVATLRVSVAGELSVSTLRVILLA
jgi:hypothetical protein